MFTDPSMTIQRISPTYVGRGGPFHILVFVVKCVVLLMLLFLCATTWRNEQQTPQNVLQQWQQDGSQYVYQNLKRVALLYVGVQAVRGTLSVAQHSTLSLQPAGVGAVIATGRVLEPLNELLHTFSDVLLVAMASLGIQQLLLTMSEHVAIWYLLLITTILYAVIIFLPSNRRSFAYLKYLIICMCFFVIVLRFFMLFFVLFAGWFFSAFLADSATKNTLQLNASIAKIELPEADSEKVSNRSLKNFFTNKVQEVVALVRARTEKIIVFIRDLISILLLEMIFVPLLFVVFLACIWKVIKILLYATQTEIAQRAKPFIA